MSYLVCPNIQNRDVAPLDREIEQLYQDQGVDLDTLQEKCMAVLTRTLMLMKRDWTKLPIDKEAVRNEELAPKRVSRIVNSPVFKTLPIHKLNVCLATIYYQYPRALGCLVKGRLFGIIDTEKWVESSYMKEVRAARKITHPKDAISYIPEEDPDCISESNR